MRRSQTRSQRRRGAPAGGGSPGPDLVYGRNPVRETLRASPGTIRRLWVVRGAHDVDDVLTAARDAGLAVELADAPSLDELTGHAHHQGVVAETLPFAYTPLDDLLARGARLLVALDGISDPQNLGAIIRSAEVLGGGGVILPRDRAAPVTAAALRASSGAAAHLPVAQVVNLVRALEDAKARDYWIVALEAGAPQTIGELPALDRAVVVVGAEGTGLRRLVATTADFRVSLPVRGRVSSLNASAAAAIAIFVVADRIERTSTVASVEPSR